MKYSLTKKLAVEALGTGLLLAIVVGSGIMGEALTSGNDAMALLANALATGAGLYVLITIFRPVSGAHLNPAVTLAFLLRRDIDALQALAYVAAQFVGGVAGVILAHAMFDLEILQASAKVREGFGQGVSEIAATFGLVLTILGCSRFRPDAVAAAVGLYITAGHWFTASTSFANPAVTVARTMTNTFAGIKPADAPLFMLMVFLGGGLAAAFAGWLFTPQPERAAPD